MEAYYMNNGYCTIDYNGEKIGLKFGLEANGMFLRKFAEYPDDFIAAGYVGVKHMSYLIYAGYINNCMVKDEEPKIKPGQFAEWVEEVSLEDSGKVEMERIANCYSESKFTKRAIKNVDDVVEEVKKNLIEMQQNLSNPTVTENSDAAESSTSP